MPEKKAKIGRPKLPKGHARGEMIQFRAQPGERERLEKVAKVSESTISETVRSGLEESMRERNVHRILDEWRRGKPLKNLSAIDIQDIRFFTGIGLAPYRKLSENVTIFGTRTTFKDIRELQHISQNLPTE